ncbi:MAG: DUF3300 domain-containing protein [Syntrophorhabdales bacterium]|jgi:hypothetical protein
MKSRRGICARLLLWSLVLLIAAPPGGIMAQVQGSGGQTMFRQEELDQMLAPIALYPDELLVQVLMAATYPLEVVQATRWVQANPNLRGNDLAAALEQQDWDPSVKSLVNFPSVLQMMNDQLEWTQRLGDAFLGQKDQVMGTVQQLRQRAQAQGSLRTTNEQSVMMDPQTQEISIEPVTPQMVYVPVYDPMTVYGQWWWPAYQPYRYYPRGAVLAAGIVGLGVAIGVAWGYAWGGFDWHRHNVTINVTRNVNINNRIDRNRYASHVTAGSGGQGMWSHDPAHRGGVAYRTPAVAQQYGRGSLPGADTRRDYRGFNRGGGGPVAAQGPNRPPAQQARTTAGPSQARPEAARQPSAPVQQPRVTSAPPVAKAEPARQPSAPSRRAVQGVQGSAAFGGGPASQTRQVSNRGHESLASARAASPAPGASRTPPGSGGQGGASRGGSPRTPPGGERRK